MFRFCSATAFVLVSLVVSQLDAQLFRRFSPRPSRAPIPRAVQPASASIAGNGCSYQQQQFYAQQRAYAQQQYYAQQQALARQRQQLGYAPYRQQQSGLSQLAPGQTTASNEPQRYAMYYNPYTGQTFIRSIPNLPSTPQLVNPTTEPKLPAIPSPVPSQVASTNRPVEPQAPAQTNNELQLNAPSTSQSPDQPAVVTQQSPEPPASLPTLNAPAVTFTSSPETFDEPLLDELEKPPVFSVLEPEPTQLSVETGILGEEK